MLCNISQNVLRGRIIFFRRRREEPKRGAITALRKAVPLEMPFKKQRSQGFREKALNV